MDTDDEQEEILCPAILKSGKRKGKICGLKAKYAGGWCGNHQKRGVLTDDEETSSVGTSQLRKLDIVHLSEKVYVCNVKGSSKDTGNWKKFWEKHTNQEYPKTCRAKDCERKAKATGHMFLRDESKKHNYLVPICSHHNSAKYDDNYFLLKKTTIAVKILENKNIHS